MIHLLAAAALLACPGPNASPAAAAHAKPIQPDATAPPTTSVTAASPAAAATTAPPIASATTAPPTASATSAPPTSPDATASNRSIPFAGCWLLVEDAGDDVNAAIARAVSALNFALRPVARNRLRRSNTSYSTVSIETERAEVAISLGGGKPTLSPVDGTPTPWTRDTGEELVITTTLSDDRLVQLFIADDGQRENAFLIDPDGRLVMHVTISSPRLPEALSYRLVYRRDASLDVSSATPPRAASRGPGSGP